MNTIRLYTSSLLLAFICALTLSLAQAEPRTIEVQPNDTLSEIVSTYYEVDANQRLRIMAYVLAQNPDAFSSNTMDSLRAGRSLTLPDLQSIPNLQQADTSATIPTTTTSPRVNEQVAPTPSPAAPTEPPPVGEAEPLLDENGQPVDMAAMEVDMLNQQLDALEAANTEIRTENKALKQEVAQLQAQVENNATNTANAPEPAPADTEPLLDENGQPIDMAAMEMDILNQQLDALEAANEEIRAENETLKQQLTTIPTETDEPSANTADIAALRNELSQTKQDLQAAERSLANTAGLLKDQNQGLPWWLLGLLLLALPVMWLLGRKSRPNSAETPATALASHAHAPNVPLQLKEAPQALSADPTDTHAATTPPLDNAAALPTTPVQSDNANAVAANDDTLEAALKLDIARAYLDLRDPQSAQPILQEVVAEGSQQQAQEAKEILSFLS